MPLSNYPNGFAGGVNIRGLPVLNTHSGNVFWVDSGTGSDGNKGTFDRPFATLDYAVGRCTANNGDLILVKAGHAETLSADSAVDIDVAGVSVIGLGSGADRPTFTFDTAVAADFKLAANNVTVQNLLFVAGIDALTGPIEISGDDCSLINCEYRDDSTNNYETTDVVVTASTPLRMLIDGFKYVHDGGTGGTQNQSVIQLNGADFAILRNCWLVGDSGTGVIEDATVSDQIMIENCVVENTETSPTVAIFLQATTTGTIRNSNLRVASGTTYLTATNDMQLFEVFGTGTDATTGEKVGTQLAGDIEAKVDVIDGYHDVPTADVTTNAQMRDVIGNKTDAAAAGAVSTTESLMAYLKQIVTRQGVELDTDTLGAILMGGGGIATWPSAAAPANGISLAEALRYISEQQSIRYVTRSASVLSNGLDLFTVTGTIAVKYLYLLCATANDATASTIQFNAVPTVGTATTLSGASASVANAAAGATISLAGTALATAALYAANGPNLIANPGTVLVPAGVIDVVVAVGSTTGTWSAHLVYEPLSSGASVAAA